jgi:hypothetical protein
MNKEETMAEKKPTGVAPTTALQPPVKINPNPPAATLAQALKNSQAQVDKAK